MARFQFTADYDHRWPSRARTHYRADGGPEGDGTYIVRREVAERAEKAGKGTWLDKPATLPADGVKRKAADSVVRGDHAAGGNDTSGDQLEPGKRARRRPRVSKPRSAG